MNSCEAAPEAPEPEKPFACHEYLLVQYHEELKANLWDSIGIVVPQTGVRGCLLYYWEY